MARKAARTRRALKKDVAYCECQDAGGSPSQLRTQGGAVRRRLWSASWCVPCSPQLHSRTLLNMGNNTCESVAGRRNTSLTLQWTGYFVRSLGVPFFVPPRSLAAYIVLEVGNSPTFIK